MIKYLLVMLFLIFMGQYCFCQITDTITSQTGQLEKKYFFQRIYQYFEDAKETKEDKRFDFLKSVASYTYVGVLTQFRNVNAKKSKIKVSWKEKTTLSPALGWNYSSTTIPVTLSPIRRGECMLK